MIISEDHILQEELNNLTCILLAREYPLHLIIKNIKKALIHNRNNLLSQQTPQTETNILPIVTPFSDILANYPRQLYIRIGTQLSMTPQFPLYGHPNPYQPIPNPAAFTTILSTLHKYMAPHNRIPNTTTRNTSLHQYRHTHSDIRTVIHPQWLHFFPPQCQTHPTNLDTMDNHNGTSRHAMKIKISPNDYGTHQRAHSCADHLGTSVIHY